MISVKNVTKSYGTGENKFQVLKGIDLDINEGEFAVILGASGSGKSTLLSVISGLEVPDGGSVRYGECELRKMSDRELTAFRRENVGFVFQQYYLLGNMTVENNVRMGADLADNDDWRGVIKAVGLEDKMKKYPRELSGGEQQRVAIARSRAKKPRVLFMDEPTGALDEETGRQVLDYILQLQKEQKFTVVMVTHNQNIAEAADTVVKLGSGKISAISKNGKRKTAYEIGW